MRSLLLASVMVIVEVIASGRGAVQAQPAVQDPSPPACVKDSNVDSCWSAGVAAEKRNDAAAALANYERSCAAGFQMGGCYEAGKIYFLDPAHRNYGIAKDRMTLVCDSDDAGIGPYACKYLGIIYRNGLTAKPQVDLAFRPLPLTTWGFRTRHGNATISPIWPMRWAAPTTRQRCAPKRAISTVERSRHRRAGPPAAWRSWSRARSPGTATPWQTRA